MEYQSPLVTRYASPEMVRFFSEEYRARTWRQVWTALAQSQHDVGLVVSSEQVEELRSRQDHVDLGRAKAHEERLQHDVLAHIAVYGEDCPIAKPIIHLGATSCDITDNGDLIIYHDALLLVHRRLRTVIDALAKLASQYKDLPVTGYTHFQPAQPSTLGLRFCLYMQDLIEDRKNIDALLANWRLRGLRGATGTQASFLMLCGSLQKVGELEKQFLHHLGHMQTFAVTGQTYPRKFDATLARALASIGESVHKCGTDLRLLQHAGEVLEPFGKKQKGSSAMPHKRNPMLSERLCSLGRLLLNGAATPSQTAATQWLERSLDDSASRRIVMAEQFMLADAVLILLEKIIRGLDVRTDTILAKLDEHLPHLGAESILMHLSLQGADRQAMHTLLRDLAMRYQGKAFLIEAAKALHLSSEQLSALLAIRRLIGNAPELVEEFLRQESLSERI